MRRGLYLNGMRLLMAMLMGLFFGFAANGVSTVYAAEATQEEVAIEEEQTPLASDTEENSGGAFLLMGGFLIIMLAVVIAVVSTFVSTAAIADEL